jgi:serralysin
VLDSQLMDLQQIHGAVPTYGGNIIIDETMPGDALASISLLTVGSPSFYEGTSFAFLEGNLEYSTTSNATAIERLYDAALGRSGDVVGLSFWIGRAEGGQSLAEIGTALLNSDEGVTAGRWQGTDSQFVDDLYQQVLGRPSDGDGVQYWEQELANGAERGAVLAKFLDSAEHLANAPGELVFVMDTDKMAIARTMDTFQLWDDVSYKAFSESVHTALESGESWQDIIGNVYDAHAADVGFSAGDDATFVAALYQDMLGRGSDAEGLAYWEEALATGASRAEVVERFAFSSEMIGHQVQVMDNVQYSVWQ